MCALCSTKQILLTVFLWLVSLSVCLSIRLSTHSFISLFICPSVCPSVCPLIHLFIHSSTCPPACPFISLFVHLFVVLSANLVAYTIYIIVQTVYVSWILLWLVVAVPCLLHVVCQPCVFPSTLHIYQHTTHFTMFQVDY